MTKVSKREKEYLDMVLYLRHKLPVLLPEDQAAKLESFIEDQLDDYEKEITSETVAELLRAFRDYEPARLELEALADGYLLNYSGPAMPKEEAPMIPLGEWVVCPNKEEHAEDSPFRTGTKLRYQGQQCPKHDVFLVSKSIK
jgi:hypothetical protein